MVALSYGLVQVGLDGLLHIGGQGGCGRGDGLVVLLGLVGGLADGGRVIAQRAGTCIGGAGGDGLLGVLDRLGRVLALVVSGGCGDGLDDLGVGYVPCGGVLGLLGGGGPCLVQLLRSVRVLAAGTIAVGQGP